MLGIRLVYRTHTRARADGRYTEVALNKSIRTSVVFLFIAVAVGCQQEIISHNPQSRAQGVKAFEEGSYADAAGSFRHAVRADPRDNRSQYSLGRCYEKMNEPHQAIQAYKASLDAQP